MQIYAVKTKGFAKRSLDHYSIVEQQFYKSVSIVITTV